MKKEHLKLKTTEKVRDCNGRNSESKRVYSFCRVMTDEGVANSLYSSAVGLQIRPNGFIEQFYNKVVKRVINNPDMLRGSYWSE